MCLQLHVPEALGDSDGGDQSQVVVVLAPTQATQDEGTKSRNLT